MELRYGDQGKLSQSVRYLRQVALFWVTPKQTCCTLNDMRIPVVCILGHNRCTIQNNTIVYSNFHFYILQCYIYIVLWVTVLDGSFSLGNCHCKKYGLIQVILGWTMATCLAILVWRLVLVCLLAWKFFRKRCLKIVLVTLSLNTYILINVGC